MSDSKTLTLITGKCPSADLALRNLVYLHPNDYAKLDSLRKRPPKESTKRYVQIKDYIFTYAPHDDMKEGTLGLTSAQRNSCGLSFKDKLDLKPYSQKSDNMYIATAHFQVDFLKKNSKSKDAFDVAEMGKVFLRQFATQFFTVGQTAVIEFQKTHVTFAVVRLSVADLDSLDGSEKDAAKLNATDAQRGVLMNSSCLTLEKAPGSNITLAGDSGAVGGSGLLLDWDFEKMGIGGLDAEFNAIFRRAFASRIYPPSVIQKLGINHVRGLLLYGPPGTGKTLMARQIGKMLNGREPVIVSGPEVLNKFVGQSEENIRKLFAEAEKEQEERGLDSDLHIIIMDELDAICRARGSTTASAGVGDTVVNQLLAKIDGVNPLHNILVIGMTNRKELIDPALMRPGRLEVHIEISLPDADGRVQILNIHTAKMRNNGLLDNDVDIDGLARDGMKNFSGAEIEGVVKAAASWAFQRQVNPSDLKNAPNPDELRVTQVDFDRALTEIKPAFGVSQDDFDNAIPNGIVYYSSEFTKMMNTCRLFVEQVHHSARTPLVSVLLEGARGTGKTAVAATLALESRFPFVKLITPEKLVGFHDTARVEAIAQAFNDAYKSPLSVLVVDDIERLIEYVPASPARFSNTVLQSLAVLLRKRPPKGRRLLVIGTCASHRALKELQLDEAFDSSIRMPQICSPQDLRTFLTDPNVNAFDGKPLESVLEAFPPSFGIGVKKLIMLIEMARQGKPSAFAERFSQLLLDYSMKKL